jgi:hypothetical protein
MPEINSTTEIWKEIPCFNSYEVSNLGRIRRSRPAPTTRIRKILKPSPDDRGYFGVVLRRDGRSFPRRVHVLVAKAFLGPCPYGFEVNHIHEPKTDNRADNLEYLTHSENVLHARRNGLIHLGENRFGSKLTDEVVREIRVSPETGISLARKYRVTPAAIYLVRKRRTWSHVE